MKQAVGIPMGIDPEPFWAHFFYIPMKKKTCHHYLLLIKSRQDISPQQTLSLMIFALEIMLQNLEALFVIYSQRSLSLKSESRLPKDFFIWFNESPLKTMKIDFYFMLKGVFVLKIFQFFVRLFWSCRKTVS